MLLTDPFKNYTIAPFGGKSPHIDPSVFICDGVRIIGDAVIGGDSSIWFNTVIRADINYITIGKRTNIQDNCTVHVTKSLYAVIVGDDVTVGHGAILHGCTISNDVLIGMGSVVLDGAIINSHSLIAAGSLVLQKTVVPEGVLMAGVPAKIIRPLREDEVHEISQAGKNYCSYVQRYREGIGKDFAG